MNATNQHTENSTHQNLQNQAPQKAVGKNKKTFSETKAKKDIYQEVTNNIIEALEKISLEDYQAPFASLTAQQLPINPMTENRYRGINTLILWLQQQKQGYS